MNTDKDTAKMLVPMARAFGYSVGRLRQTPRNADTLKVPRFFMCVHQIPKVQRSNPKSRKVSRKGFIF